MTIKRRPPDEVEEAERAKRLHVLATGYDEEAEAAEGAADEEPVEEGAAGAEEDAGGAAMEEDGAGAAGGGGQYATDDVDYED